MTNCGNLVNWYTTRPVLIVYTLINQYHECYLLNNLTFVNALFLMSSISFHVYCMGAIHVAVWLSSGQNHGYQKLEATCNNMIKICMGFFSPHGLLVKPWTAGQHDVLPPRGFDQMTWWFHALKNVKTAFYILWTLLVANKTNSR